jgi:tetratricopeptide (TPR) repeat protein
MRASILLLFLTNIALSQTIDNAKKLWENKKPAEAKTLLQGVKEQNKEYAEAQYWLGFISYQESDFESAEVYFENAIEVNDKKAEYYNWYGNTLGAMAGNANIIKQGMLAPKMKSAWEKAVSLKPDYIDPRISLIQYYLQAPSMMGGSVEKAMEMATQIKKLKPAEGHRQLGNIYYREKKFEEAEKEFIAMVKADPSYESALANYYINQKQYSKAFTIFEKTLEQNPNDMLAAYQYGKVCALSGERLDKGEAYLRKYLTYTPKQNEPSHAGTNMRLGQIAEKRGNKSEAKKLFESALKADATLKEAKDGLERVSK